MLTRRTILTPLLLVLAVQLAHVALGQEPAGSTKKEKVVKKLRIEVSAESSGDPLAHATVHVSSARGEWDDTSPTGSDGSVTFSGVPVGKLTLQVTLTGWKDFGKEYDVIQQEKVTISIHLQKEKKGSQQ